MPIHNKSHFNHALMSLNKINRDRNSLVNITATNKIRLHLDIADCMDFLKKIPDNSIQLICIDPPYNLELASWDIYDNYIAWAEKWLDESYRILSEKGNLIIFGGIQFRDVKSGDIIDIIHHVRKKTKFKLINTIIWHYKNGMSAQRYFANRHEEIIWLAKTNDYYFDLDAVREPYSEKDLEAALHDKRLNPENIKKGKNPTNVWDICRLNGNSKERTGHPTQKPVELITRIIKALSFSGSIVLDFFAGSCTVGRVCITEGRNCLMCDKDQTSITYFQSHLQKMHDLGLKTEYTPIDTIEKFFLSFNANQ